MEKMNDNLEILVKASKEKNFGCSGWRMERGFLEFALETFYRELHWFHWSQAPNSMMPICKAFLDTQPKDEHES